MSAILKSLIGVAAAAAAAFVMGQELERPPAAVSLINKAKAVFGILKPAPEESLTTAGAL